MFLVKLTAEAKPAACPLQKSEKLLHQPVMSSAAKTGFFFFLILQLILDPFALTNKLLPLKDLDFSHCLVAWPWALLHSNHVIMSAEKACAALQFTLSL